MTYFLLGLVGMAAFLTLVAFVGWVYVRFWLAPDLNWGWSDVPKYLEKGIVGLWLTAFFLVLVFIFGLIISTVLEGRVPQ